MARPVCKAYTERNAAIAKRYADEQESLQDLADAYGRSRSRVRSILEDQGITLRSEPRRTYVVRRARNNILLSIGTRLHFDRLKRKMSLSEYATMIGLSEARLSEALQGLYNWRYTEMLRAANTLGISLERFITPPAGDTLKPE